MAPLIREFKKYPDVFETLVCVTGQHRLMLDQVLFQFDIVPDFDLDIMKSDQDLYDISIKVLTGMRDIFQKITPDLVFVHGDTTSSVATALAAFYHHIPVAHVEAGLRTHNIQSPWPEEMNRTLISHMAKWHFAPTMSAKQNLESENILENDIIVTGNTAIDSLHWVTARINEDSGLEALINTQLKKEGYDNNLSEIHRRLILITGHRRENFGEGFQRICNAIKSLSESHHDVDFVYPVHLNPNVRKPVLEILGKSSKNGNIYLINPLDYLSFVYLMSKSHLVLTDSGGIQEEAPALGKPVILMRDNTERPEAIEAGTVIMVGTDPERIEQEVSNLLDNKNLYKTMSKAINPYGNGNAAEKIVSFFRNMK